MSEVAKEISMKIRDCVKSETGIDLLDPSAWPGLSPDQRQDALSSAFQCYFRVIKNLVKKKYVSWIEWQTNELMMSAESVGRRLLRYGTRTRDPTDFLQSILLYSASMENLAGFFEDSDILSDHKLIARLLLISWLDEGRYAMTLNSMWPLFDVFSLAQGALGRDANWCISLIALTIEELLIKKKAGELDVETEKEEGYPHICDKLIEKMEKEGIRVDCELLLGTGHRKIRNRILHEGWNPTEEDTEGIIAHVFKLAEHLRTVTPGH